MISAASLDAADGDYKSEKCIIGWYFSERYDYCYVMITSIHNHQRNISENTSPVMTCPRAPNEPPLGSVESKIALELWLEHCKPVPPSSIGQSPPGHAGCQNPACAKVWLNMTYAYSHTDVRKNVLWNMFLRSLKQVVPWSSPFHDAHLIERSDEDCHATIVNRDTWSVFSLSWIIATKHRTQTFDFYTANTFSGSHYVFDITSMSLVPEWNLVSGYELYSYGQLLQVKEL